MHEPDLDAAYYRSTAVNELLAALEEATRASPSRGPAEFVSPAGGELEQVQARFHHLIFGRRGSGKTTLLRYLESQLREASRTTVWIDQELFMALSYPDVLVSSVLEVMEGARRAVVAAQNAARDSWWRRTIGRGRDSRLRRRAASTALARAIANLQTLKHLPNDRKIEWTRTAAPMIP